MEKTSITVTPERLERFNKLKAEATAEDMPEQSADLFLKSLMDTWDAVDDGHYNSDTEELVEQLKAEIDSLAYDGAVFDDEAQRIMNRIDDLESQLPAKVAEEMQR